MLCPRLFLQFFTISGLVFSGTPTSGWSNPETDGWSSAQGALATETRAPELASEGNREFSILSTDVRPADFPEKQGSALVKTLPTRASLVSVSEGCFIQSFVFSERLERTQAFDQISLYNVSLEGRAGGTRDHTLVLISYDSRWTAYEMHFGLIPLPRARTLDAARTEVDRMILRKIRNLGGRLELSKAYQQLMTVSAQVALQEAYRLVASQTSLIRVDKAGSKTGVIVFITNTGLMCMYEPGNGTAWGASLTKTLPSEEWVNHFLTSSAGFRGLRSIRS